MVKRIKTFISVFLALDMIFGVTAHALSVDGFVPYGYTPVRTAQEFDSIRNNLKGNYIIMNDIDLGEYENWAPIGDNYYEAFKGKIYGGLHKITNLKITISDEDELNPSEPLYAGLFGYAVGAEIKGLNVFGNISIASNKGFAGGVCARCDNGSFISECISNVDINVESKDAGESFHTGGVIGELYYSSLTQCANYGNITVDFHFEDPNNSIWLRRTINGGVVGGALDSKISDCRNQGCITVNENSEPTTSAATGGIVGAFHADVDSIDYDLEPWEEVPWGIYPLIHNTCNTGSINVQPGNGGNASVGEWRVFDWGFGDPNVPELVKGCYYLDTSCENGQQGYRAECFTSFSESETNENNFSELDFDKIWTFLPNSNIPVLKIEEKASAINLNMNIGETIIINTDGASIESAASDNESVACVVNDSIKGQKSGTALIKIIFDNGTESSYYVIVHPDQPELIDATIVESRLPDKNRIVSKNGEPEYPDGIVIQFIYSDTKRENVTIEERDGKYYAKDEEVKYIGKDSEEPLYGNQTAYLEMKNGEIKMSYEFYSPKPGDVIYAEINVAEAETISYRTKVTLKATASNLDSEYHLVLVVNGSKITGDNKEVAYEYGELTSDLNYFVKIADRDGNFQKDPYGRDIKKDGGTITCNDGFFRKLIAFFQWLFNALPEKTVQP
ncbi:MAG: hypothetical protein IJK60_07110, partial [Clostridia bacterium]|nr:hypothetical protein [Clostridia bacterium]